MARTFEWDERKAALNLDRHGLSFQAATAVFADPHTLEFDTTRAQDGETRSKAIGMIGSRLHTVVFTMRGDATRLISARPANRPEERRYGDRALHS